MRILGIDPGLATLGYGLIEINDDGSRIVAKGALKTPAADPEVWRVRQVYTWASESVARWLPDAVALERPNINKNSPLFFNAVPLGMAYGALAVAFAGQDLHEYQASQIKLAVAGHGKAKKPQVRQAVALYFGLDELKGIDDAIDGVAIALTHWRYLRREGIPA